MMTSQSPLLTSCMAPAAAATAAAASALGVSSAWHLNQLSAAVFGSSTSNNINMAAATAFVTASPRSRRPPPPRTLFLEGAELLQQPPTVLDLRCFDKNDSDAAASDVPLRSSQQLIPKEKSLRHKLGLPSQTNAATNKQYSTAVAAAKVIGHRGALYDCLENTREGFLRCADLGCAAVELDVFVIADGTVVVFHGNNDEDPPGGLADYCILDNDDNDDDQGGRTRTILDLSFAQTQELKFNPNFAEFPCPPHMIASAKIPTLEQVLTDLRDYDSTTNSASTNSNNSKPMEIKIELKGPGVVKPVLEIVERLGMVHRCSYSSFCLSQLEELRALRPDRTLYRTGALFEKGAFLARPPQQPPNSNNYKNSNYLQLARSCGATEIHLPYDECHVDRIRDEIHAAGFGSMAWCRGPIGMAHDAVHTYWDVGGGQGHEEKDEVETAACYELLLATGVQQICCNRPNLLLQVISSVLKKEQERVLDDDDEGVEDDYDDVAE